MKKVILGYGIAAVFWFIMFSPWTAPYVNFWHGMLLATSTLTAYTLFQQRKKLKEVYHFEVKWILIGIIAAIALYLVFWAGNFFSNLLFNFAKPQISSIYNTKEQANAWFIGISLLLLIGPSEEIFWRGYAQAQLAERFGEIRGMIINTLIYALVHIWSFNFMLVMAALVCGVFWGMMKLRFKSIMPAIISHAIWDLTIFILLPIA